MLLPSPTPALPVEWGRLSDATWPFVAPELGHPASRMAMTSSQVGGGEDGYHHVSVLFEEAIHYMAPERGKVMVDATLGGGGHSRALLERGCKVIGLDQDPAALVATEKRLAHFGGAFQSRHCNFSEVEQAVKELAPEGIDGFLMDLGVSSHQLDTAERGFSLRADGPLDMRMDPTRGITAAEIVNEWDESEIADVIWRYGEERKSRAVARAIVRRRSEQSFERTLDLAELVASVVNGRGKTHPATRTFQALRLKVNSELEVLEKALEAAPGILRPGGRLVVISFHSLEDRIVKHFFKSRSERELDRPEWPEPRRNPDYSLEVLTRRPVTAAGEELSANPRARSAKLRAARRV